MTAGPRKRIRGRVAAIAIGVLAALVATELALQVGSYVIWRNRGREVAGEGRVVLCAGDSYTYGLGCEDPSVGSYPRRLDAELEAAPNGPWSVVQGGWPGQTSRDLLAALPAQLRRYEPEFVYLLIGINDNWKRPALLQTAAARAAGAGADDGFPIQWRTGRLFSLMRGWWAGAPGGDTAFLGVWHRDDVELEFEPGGRLRVDGHELRWMQRDGALFVVVPPQQVIAVRFQRDGDKLMLRSDAAALSQEWVEGPAPDPSPLEQGQRALRERRFDAAAAAFASCLEDSEGGEDAVAAHEGLVHAEVGRGDPTAAQAHLDWLEQRHRRAPDRAVAEALAHARVALGDAEGGVRAAVAVVGEHPDSIRAWAVLMGAGMMPARRPQVLDAVDSALRQLPADHAQRIDVLHLRGLLLRSTDPVAALRSHFEAVLAGGAESFAMEHLYRDRASYTDDVLARCLQAMALSPDDAARLRRLHRDAMRGRGGVLAVLEAHLRSAVELCREAGAVPVLLTYPSPQPAHEQIVEKVAGSMGAAWVAIRPEFTRLLQTRAQDELFIADGHCTDAGYAVLARLVAADLWARAR